MASSQAGRSLPLPDEALRFLKNLGDHIPEGELAPELGLMIGLHVVAAARPMAHFSIEVGDKYIPHEGVERRQADPWRDSSVMMSRRAGSPDGPIVQVWPNKRPFISEIGITVGESNRVIGGFRDDGLRAQYELIGRFPIASIAADDWELAEVGASEPHVSGTAVTPEVRAAFGSLGLNLYNAITEGEDVPPDLSVLGA